ncbi:PREDICTED: uncharacterized protein LOC106749359 [Dinoponera quadriceps]|uniref:Uncharacterized protein LOC106749359 n=1 Tax=Dinoponera quadriceps TaxID=609295 RepID=A0A6P3Y0A1_DINQU|nr:PREDICTED: uncharacterized protein LOC106749359 [Dinoponera quadriceps]
MIEIRNYNCEEDIRYTVQVHRLILRLIGVWPVLEKSWHGKRLLKRLLNCVCCFLLSFNLIPWALHMFVIIDTFKARLRMLGALCFYTMVYVIYCMLIHQEDRIRDCVRHVEEDWRNVKDVNDRKIMLDKAKLGRFILITATLFLFTSGFTHRLIKPIIRGSIVVNENLTIRPLVQGNYYIFFDPQQSPAYEIVFSVQCLSGIVIYIVTASVCGVTALFTMHACGQLEMLISWLENLASDDQLWKDHVAARRLATIILHHVRIRK